MTEGLEGMEDTEGTEGFMRLEDLPLGTRGSD